MKTYRITLDIKSALSTPLKGDTIFGHICWGIVYNEGEPALFNFLSKFDTETPPMVVSDGFPSGMLPVPILSPPIPGKDMSLEDYERGKRTKKMHYLNADLFLKNDFIFTPSALTDVKLTEDLKIGVTVSRLHNTINRLSGTVAVEGSLYSSTENWYDTKQSRFDVYVLSTVQADRVHKLFEWGLENGYGADKNTGKGRMEVFQVHPVSFPQAGNRMMSLGGFVPSEQDNLTNLRTDIYTKFGKLGGDYVLWKNPFKKPIVLYQAGATFDYQEGKLYAGSLLRDVHSDKGIRHHAMAPLISFKEEEEAS